ncbi:Acyl-CoA hydrolase 2-like protein [Drosera capensis]
MPSVPSPDQLLNLEELRERRIMDPRLPRTYRNKVAIRKLVPWPIEIRFCDPSTSTNQTKSEASLRYWFRAKGKLSDDQALHRMWFHRPAKADDWLLFVIESPTSYDARGLCLGRMFNMKGELVASLAQEGLLREAVSPDQVIRAKALDPSTKQLRPDDSSWPQSKTTVRLPDNEAVAGRSRMRRLHRSQVENRDQTPSDQPRSGIHPSISNQIWIRPDLSSLRHSPATSIHIRPDPAVAKVTHQLLGVESDFCGV